MRSPGPPDQQLSPPYSFHRPSPLPSIHLGSHNLKEEEVSRPEKSGRAFDSLEQWVGGRQVSGGEGITQKQSPGAPFLVPPTSPPFLVPWASLPTFSWGSEPPATVMGRPTVQVTCPHPLRAPMPGSRSSAGLARGTCNIAVCPAQRGRLPVLHASHPALASGGSQGEPREKGMWAVGAGAVGRVPVFPEHMARVVFIYQ